MDLAFKWRAAGPRPRALVWQSEYLRGHCNLTAGTEKQGGLYSRLQYQFARRWWAQTRWDLVGLPRPTGAERAHRLSGLLALVLSEFSALRLSYSRLYERRRWDGPGADAVQLHHRLPPCPPLLKGGRA
ncbi:MAG: hypothetical protein FJY95_17345 [Candidatus Handelsmanbacteria bacterium]|nr:hypothetical protein [Candidatus Handelsmanbacteria bacterium]